MRSFLLITLAILGLFCSPIMGAEDIKKPKVLVVLDNLALRDSHSLFFQDLENDGYKLDFKLLNYDNFKVQEFGEYLYDQMIIFSTSVQEPRFLNNERILEFFDNGHNILIAGDIDTSKNFRLLANQFGVEFDQYGSKVFDDVRKADELDSGLFFTDNQINQAAIAPKLADPILYRGIGMSLSPYENFQISAILRGTEYTYSKSYDESGAEEIISTSSKTILAAGLQGRNNARVVVTGSLDMFSNELFVKSKGANRQYAKHLTKWGFGESGVVRVDKVFHHLAKDPSHQPGEYKLLDEIVYTIDITTWDYQKKEWVPFVVEDTIQLEYVMLDPYVRIALKQVAGTPTYKAEFKLPDRHGVFQFKVTYRKPGLTFITSATKIPVRPFKHNEYERFLFEAFPYYITVFATLVGFFVFVVYFLFDSSRGASLAKKEQ